MFELPLNNFSLAHGPEKYHGHGVASNFFEGWYYKTVYPNAAGSLILIPGVFKPDPSIAVTDSRTEPHAFVMAFRHPNSLQCLYYSYPLSEFTFTNHRQFGYSLHIGGNSFSHEGMTLDLRVDNLSWPTTKDREAFYSKALRERMELLGVGAGSFFQPYERRDLAIRGSVQFSDLVRLPSSLYSPGIMGPLGYIPVLECYHGVVSVHHRTSGEVAFYNRDGSLESRVDVSRGSGYIEKDHGYNFPKSWIWLQTHSFKKPASQGSAFMLSIANVPLLSDIGTAAWLISCIPAIGPMILSKLTITGYLGFVYLAESKTLLNISLYNGAHIKDITFALEQIHGVPHQLLTIKVVQKELEVDIRCKRPLGQGIPLPGPALRSGMQLIVEESLTVHIALVVKLRGKVIFDDEGSNAGMEVVGSMAGLIARV
ncbi:hypothetical protein HDV03_000345 [Kappamyces sp. JEL0829]|nr:hypothetical protein HDV03_000345 [Kappamyces sp. JEL0829]